MKKSIVLGANGYLGSHMVHFLNKSGHEVTSVGSSEKSKFDFDNYVQIDITKASLVEQLNFDVDYIFDFAGLTGTSVGFTDYQKFIDVNEKGLLNVLNHHRNSNSNARIIFPSTRLVYKGFEGELLTENSEKEALTIYAQNKISCEEYLSMYAANFNIPYTTFRVCVPYGNVLNDEYSYGTIGFFLSKAKNGDNITLYGKGEVRRTFTHVHDICQLIISSLDKTVCENEVFNIGSNDNLSLLEVASKVGAKYGVGLDFIDWPEAAKKIESGDTMFNDTKQQELIGYQYQCKLDDWLKSI